MKSHELARLLLNRPNQEIDLEHDGMGEDFRNPLMDGNPTIFSLEGKLEPLSGLVVRVDGLEIPVLNEVKVIADAEEPDDPDTKGDEIHITYNHEGAIHDLVSGKGTVCHTFSQFWSDIITDLVI